jgi:ribosomal protein L37E
MTQCVKCGHDPEKHLCPFCGYPNQTLGNYDGKLLTICCRKDPTKTTKGGK